MECANAWKLTQRMNVLPYTGSSLPSTGYTAINTTVELQYISSGRLTSSTVINIRHTIYTCSSYNSTQLALQKKLLTNINWLAGT